VWLFRSVDPGSVQSMEGIIGYRWRVTHLVDATGPLPVPSSLRAEIGFTRDGYVLGNDSVNAMQGNYEATDGGYSVRSGGGTFALYGGSDPVRRRTIDAVDAMFINRPTVKQSLDGDILTLRTGGITLTLQRAGVQPAFLPGIPSATKTTPDQE
jgi:hypothetical protein